MADRFGADQFEVRREELVGPKIGHELGKNAIWAVVIGLGAILVYVAFRFEFRFAVAAVAALFHDVLVTVGIFSLTDKEISLAVVAALLTIVGYSLNDTIVVFDRIREDLRKYHRERFEGVINASINETLSRTIMTSLTTLIVVLFLFFLGGEVLRDFSFALIIGIIVGTYSSVFVASPILVEWHRKSPQRRR
jgi:preprotein translocase SecF subunit